MLKVIEEMLLIYLKIFSVLPYYASNDTPQKIIFKVTYVVHKHNMPKWAKQTSDKGWNK